MCQNKLTLSREYWTVLNYSVQGFTTDFQLSGLLTNSSRYHLTTTQHTISDTDEIGEILVNDGTTSWSPRMLRHYSTTCHLMKPY